MLEQAKRLDEDEAWAEKVDAFSSRFCLYQDTLGGELIPLWLKLIAEKRNAYIYNLNIAERLGVLSEAENWLMIRSLRNKMMHDYIEDLTVLSSALQSAHESVRLLRSIMLNILKDLERGGLYGK